MAGPDLQIRAGPGCPDREIRGGGGAVSKKFFLPSGHQFGPKVRAAHGPPPLDLPLSSRSKVKLIKP